MWLSILTWGPPGARYPMMRPGPGRKFLKGSSALMRHSMAWPCTGQPHVRLLKQAVQSYVQTYSEKMLPSSRAAMLLANTFTAC